jgi:hypothetical protein
MMYGDSGWDTAVCSREERSCMSSAVNLDMDDLVQNSMIRG